LLLSPRPPLSSDGRDIGPRCLSVGGPVPRKTCLVRQLRGIKPSLVKGWWCQRRGGRSRSLRRSGRRRGRKSGRGGRGKNRAGRGGAATPQETTEAVVVVATVGFWRTRDSRSNNGSGPSGIWAASRRVGRGEGGRARAAACWWSIYVLAFHTIVW